MISILATDVGSFWTMGAWELEFLSWINVNMHGSSFVNYLFYFLTVLGDHGIIFILLGLAFLIFKKTRRCGIYLLISLAVVALLGNNLIIKHAVSRARPFYEETINNYRFAENYREFVYQMFPEKTFFDFGAVPDSYSFVSGHTVGAFVGATIVFMFFKKTGIGMYIFATLIGFSRLFFAVHYPTDVIFGAIYATAASVGMFYLIKYLEPKALKLLGDIINKIKTKRENPKNENR